MSFFNKSSKAAATGVAGMVETLKHATQGAPVVTIETAKSAVALESISQGHLAELESAASSLKTMLQQSMTTVRDLAGLSVAQEEAAVVASVLANAPVAYMGKKVSTGAEINALAGANTVVMGSMQGALEQRSFSMEAFDERANKNAMVYSMVYNAQAARQDEFGEAFFPTVVQTPDQVGYIVSIKLIEVIDTIRREVSGNVNNFNRKNIVKASIDHTVLRNDITKIVPVYRNGVSSQFFSADVGQTTVDISGEQVVTGALVIGKKFSLLGISQTDAAVAAGLQDETDAVDSAAKLAAIYVKLKDGDVVKFRTGNTPTASFNNSIQGNARQLQLSFSTSTLQVTGATKQVDGTDLTGKATLGTSSVRLSTSLMGSINQQQGDTQINAMSVEVVKAFDDAGNVLSTASGPGAAIAALFADAVVVGYDLLAYRTNSNRRNRGQIVDTREMNYLYPVPILPPITALRPVSTSDANDAALLSTLITTTRVRTSNAAVTELLSARDYLKEYASAVNSAADAPEVFGAARELVTPAYLEAQIDVATAVDSIKSSDRAEDVVALLVNKIRDMAFRLYQKSGYKAAADALSGGVANKPTVIIGTDPVIYRYLTLQGEMRLMGDAFNFKVVSTLDSRVAGKIFVSFGSESSFTDGVPNALHFGNMAWKPELTLMMPATRNGANAMELTVQPMFLHVTNLPVLGYIKISGIEDIIAGKVAIKTTL